MRQTIRHTRPAFSILTALIVIVIMATIAMFVMSLSGKIVKSTGDQYQHEQAELYAKSYTEYAVLAITGNNRAANCLNTITGTANGHYNIRVDIAYIGYGIPAGCANILSNAVATPETPLSAMIDVYVTYPDPDHPDDLNLTVHRRTIQKI